MQLVLNIQLELERDLHQTAATCERAEPRNGLHSWSLAPMLASVDPRQVGHVGREA
ncbi:MAG: hypothetical protein J2P54_06555 [Bradyrhizobiaceae bacterium]|nr:hypothetical protein [Bradyrhizobiaceae bacterium]